MNGRHISLAAAVGVVTMLGAISLAVAHDPDPRLGGVLWAQDQELPYVWKSNQVPPAWLAAAIDAAAFDASSTRAARAATFIRPTASGASGSPIAYGEPTGCSPAGLACFDRSNAPNGFKMWFRAHNFTFDWGTLRWCQALTKIADGCYDAETIALDEFGHVEILGHHVNFDDGSDFDDAVVQTVSRARPQVGWNAHALGRCDVARLQLEYDRLTFRQSISSCLEIPTAISMTASATNLYVGDTTRFTATLKTQNLTDSKALANDPMSNRTVLLQRRLPGATTWTTIATMSPTTTTEGQYVTTVGPTATYEWRAWFSPADDEGALASSTSPLKVTVGGCSGPGCPSFVGRAS